MKHRILHTTATVLAAISLAACAASSPAAASGASGAKPYPLQTCIVTDNDLDSMGGPVSRTHQGREIKFCCKPCVRKFEANPGKYLTKLPK